MMLLARPAAPPVPGARLFLDAAAIQQRVAELGRQITADYEGRDIVAIGVLRGVVFFNDLVRAIDLPVTVDYLALSPFNPTGGIARLQKDLDGDIAGRDVLLVEDLVDTGLTLRFLTRNLAARGPASLRVCVLFDKPALRLADHPLEYAGFTAPDVPLAGYGLDDQQRFRHLPDVWDLSQTQ